MIAAWLWMNNMPEHDVANTPNALKKYFWLEAIGYVAAGVGVLVLLATRNSDIFDSSFMGIVKIIIMVLVSVVTTLALMRYATPCGKGESFGPMENIWREA
jgi:hypothetical protein